MNVKRIIYNGDFPVVTVAKRIGDTDIDTSNISINGPGGTQGKLDRLKAAVQSLIDEVVPLSEFPIDDPYIVNGNPATERIFYDGQGNIVFRNTLVENVTLEADGRYILHLRSLDHG